ncbi:hypothetical protein Mapa_008679 [Marchantia paleacea]|nr:hypothetical protein Mapa_008679 [Marchantia paleacea]
MEFSSSDPLGADSEEIYHLRASDPLSSAVKKRSYSSSLRENKTPKAATHSEDCEAMHDSSKLVEATSEASIRSLHSVCRAQPATLWHSMEPRVVRRESRC